MSSKNFGPKTGSFEPPSITEFDAPSIKDLSNEIIEQELEIKDLWRLLHNISSVYHKGDGKQMKKTIEEIDWYIKNKEVLTRRYDRKSS